MGDALRAEYRKFTSTRMWWVLLIAMVGYLGFIAVVLTFSMTADVEGQPRPTLTGPDLAGAIYSLASPMGYVFALVIGSLAVIAEFRHKTITSTLLVEPRRTLVVVAKMLAAVPIGALYGVIGTVTVVLGAAPLLSWLGDGAFLTDGRIIEVIVLSMVVMVLWTALGVAFGTVVPNQVAAIVILLAFTQLVEPIARIALGAFDATSGVAKFLPGAAADGLIGTSFYSMMGAGATDLLPRWAGGVVLVAYIVILAVVGRYTTFRRDIV
ncbi:ABC transporter permease [Gordonia sp. CPCC 205515]|uniref:ABC transporter permease n=1 Tax=Gordonia sp. CPCC 205515 TaxID=3140791 RepID=UPI003AF3877A